MVSRAPSCVAWQSSGRGGGSDSDRSSLAPVVQKMDSAISIEWKTQLVSQVLIRWVDSAIQLFNNWGQASLSLRERVGVLAENNHNNNLYIIAGDCYYAFVAFVACM